MTSLNLNGHSLPISEALPGNMKILHRYTGEMIFSCDAETVKQAVEKTARVKMPLRRANLRGVDLREAVLAGLDLGGADLRDADLRGAYLSGVNLSGAAHIGSHSIIDGGEDRHGRRFIGHWPDRRKAFVIIASGGSGERNHFFTPAEARAHWREPTCEPSLETAGDRDVRECRARVALIETAATIFGWKAEGEKPDEHP